MPLSIERPPRLHVPRSILPPPWKNNGCAGQASVTSPWKMSVHPQDFVDFPFIAGAFRSDQPDIPWAYLGMFQPFPEQIVPPPNAKSCHISCGLLDCIQHLLCQGLCYSFIRIQDKHPGIAKATGGDRGVLLRSMAVKSPLHNDCPGVPRYLDRSICAVGIKDVNIIRPSH